MWTEPSHIPASFGWKSASRTPMRTSSRGLRALGALLVALALGACGNPLGLDDAPEGGEHTTSSSNHTTSSGNLSPRGR